MSARATLRLCILSSALFFPATAHATWPNLPFVNLPVSTGPGSQIYPAILADGVGGAFLAWHDNRSGGYDLYAQHLDANGNALWTPNGLGVCSASGDQANAQFAPDGAGGVVVAWHDFRAGNWDIYAQRFNASGTPLWTANGVALCTAASNQTDPFLTTDGAGGAIVVWTDLRNLTRDVYAQRVNASGVTQWTSDGVAVSALAGEQLSPQVVTDGAGGAIFAWQDSRSGVYDIYAQRLNAAGAPLWTANGIAICTAANNQGNPAIAADGFGGAVLAWWDERNGAADIWGYRVSPSGTNLWGSTGAVLGNATGIQTSPRVVVDGAAQAIIVWDDKNFPQKPYATKRQANGSPLWGPVALQSTGDVSSAPQVVHDGAGGAIATWLSGNFGSNNVIAQRVDGSGTLRWTGNATSICQSPNGQDWPVVAPDGSGGALIAWHDFRNGAADIYAQRIDHYGLLGRPEPSITGVRDLPNDQGGKVRVSWTASYLDVEPTYGVAEYRVWRSAPVWLTFALTGSRLFTDDPDQAAATGQWWLPSGSADYAWEIVGSQSAAALSEYSLVTNTTSDSVAASNPRTVFMVEARAGTALSANRWLSLPDSGYSVDNLPPQAPSALTGQYAAGTTTLHWARNAESDLANYRLYRGSDAGFLPGPANLVATPPDTGFADPAGQPAYYKLSAVDVHGNESGYALLSPQGTVDVPALHGPLAFALAPPRPNPARATARIAFELPAETTVSLTVHDPAGRMVRRLFQGAHEAGRFQLAWDLRDDAGKAVPSGMYFVQLLAGPRRITQRMIALR